MEKTVQLNATPVLGTDMTVLGTSMTVYGADYQSGWTADGEVSASNETVSLESVQNDTASTLVV